MIVAIVSRPLEADENTSGYHLSRIHENATDLGIYFESTRRWIDPGGCNIAQHSALLQKVYNIRDPHGRINNLPIQEINSMSCTMLLKIGAATFPPRKSPSLGLPITTKSRYFGSS